MRPFFKGAAALAMSALVSTAASATTPAEQVGAVAAAAEEWPEIVWVAETDNFLQVRFRETAKQFQVEWGDLPQTRVAKGSTLRQGSSGARVAALRSRLGLTPGQSFDAELGDRIAQYRAAHGLSAGRQADANLVASLNAGFAHYSRIIESNRTRAAMMPGRLGEKFVLVDSAEQRLYMYEGESVVGTMKVIVGKQSDQTPLLVSKIDHAVLNPYWNVPADLTQSRYAGRVIRGGEAYLRRTGFEALSDWTESARVLGYREVDWKAVQAGKTQLRLRQRPGPGNGMGKIKIMFPNAFGVYLHDTPSKALFNKADRTLSAGCVRLEKPWMLAEWLFGSRPMAGSASPEQKVFLDQEVPVYLTYFTAIPTDTGFKFRSDVYAKDLT